MSVADLDPLIHAPKRLGAMALLSATTSASFGFMRDHLDVSVSDLSKQMKALGDAGYVSVKKTGHGRTGETNYRITKAGSKALKAHLEALHELVAQAASAVESVEAS